jgi:hypothetical protein
MVIPDKWVILKIIPNRQYKVFGSWFTDEWQHNSGIIKIEQTEDFYFFYGYSGSIYKCRKSSYGIATPYCTAILDDILAKTKGQIEIMPDGTQDFQCLILTQIN